MTLWVEARLGKLPPCQVGGHSHSGNRDTIVLVCHVTLQDHIIKALHDLLVSSPSRSVMILPSLMAIGTVVMEL